MSDPYTAGGLGPATAFVRPPAPPVVDDRPQPVATAAPLDAEVGVATIPGAVLITTTSARAELTVDEARLLSRALLDAIDQALPLCGVCGHGHGEHGPLAGRLPCYDWPAADDTPCPCSNYSPEQP